MFSFFTFFFFFLTSGSSPRLVPLLVPRLVLFVLFFPELRTKSSRTAKQFLRGVGVQLFRAERIGHSTGVTKRPPLWLQVTMIPTSQPQGRQLQLGTRNRPAAHAVFHSYSKTGEGICLGLQTGAPPWTFSSPGPSLRLPAAHHWAESVP